jgi:hypothetical protein
VPDEEKFLKRTSAIMMVGEQKPKKLNGKVLVDISNKAGVPFNETKAEVGPQAFTIEDATGVRMA